MARNESSTPGTERTAPTESHINVLISPVIEREYKRRDKFPSLRLENAAHIQNGASGLYKVSIECAKELLADAQAMQMRSRELPRGIPAAYSALARNIGAKLKAEARRGLWDDPGIAEAKCRMQDTPACFKVGDFALNFGRNDEYGTQVVVVRGYELSPVRADDGAYLTDDGERINYMYGYVVKHEKSGDTWFAKPCELTRGDCKPTHLRLVSHEEMRH